MITDRAATLFAASLTLILVFSTSQKSSAATASALFQTVVYLRGSGDVEQIKVGGVEHEVWIKGPTEPQPRPFRKTSSGTGFFVRKGTQIYLVTAEHVARDLKYDVSVTIHGAEDKPLTYDIKELTGAKTNAAWFYHPEADVAIMPLNPAKQIAGLITVLESEVFLLDQKEYANFKDIPLVTVGFPLDLGLRGKFSPITKSSRLGSNLFRYKRADKDVETTFLVLEDPSVQGFSGGPVYTVNQITTGGATIGGGRFAIIGLVHGTLLDNTGGKFAAIVPGYFVMQTIDAFESRRK